MYKKTRRKNGKFTILLLSLVLICGMFPVQALAMEIDSLPVTISEESETNVGAEESSSPAEETLTEDEVIVQEEGAVTTSGKTVPGTCIVAFNPDDGKTGYNDFFKVTVPTGSIVTDQPENPQRDGYLFKGWYSHLDENDNPVFWNFETGTVQHNTTLWAAWEEACLVVFDPDDGKTGYGKFFKVTVPIGGKVTDKPADPTCDGYLFRGWYAYLDENDNPVFWNFETDTVQDNTTLWAAWEEAYIVVFDFNDGHTGYNDFLVTVPTGSTITDKPEDPQRYGYLFKGWYSHLDENGNPVFWNFETGTVQHNMTLWAAWKEACPVVFSLDRDSYEKYYETLVPANEKITDRPADPIRSGYRFKGWYIDRDENDEPIWWNFETDTIESDWVLLLLWADWEEESGGNGGNNGGSGGNNGDGGNNGGSGGNSGDGGNNSGNVGNNGAGGNNSGGGTIEIEDEKTPGEFFELDDIPKTGDSGFLYQLLWLLCGVSISGMSTLILLRRKEAAI